MSDDLRVPAMQDHNGEIPKILNRSFRRELIIKARNNEHFDIQLASHFHQFDNYRRRASLGDDDFVDKMLSCQARRLAQVADNELSIFAASNRIRGLKKALKAAS